MAQVDPPIGAQLTQPLSSPWLLLGCAQLALLLARTMERNDQITRVFRVNEHDLMIK